MELHFKGNSKIFLIAFFGFLMVILSYLIYFFNPLKLIISKTVQMKDGSIVFNLFQDPPHEIHLKIYLFNCTNAEDFVAGKAKLKFEEVGPFTYQEILKNTESKFYENGTMSYVPRRSVKFLPELSVGDPKTTYVSVPNIPLLAIASMLHQSSMLLNLAVLSITKALNAQPILNLTVQDFFWGYDDRLVHLASSVLPNWISFEKLGILDRMYDEGDNTVLINLTPNRKGGNPLIAKQEQGRLYSILTYNGSPGLSQWGYQLPHNNETIETNTKCNILEGAYDGTVFPPNLTKDMVFRLYRKFFCRTVPIEFESEGFTEDGYNAFFYKIQDNFLDRYQDNPDNECYCRDKNFCLPSGLGDATPCYYGFPAAVSRPHFLNIDPKLYEKIEGMKPSEEKHGTRIAMNPEVGLVLQGVSRMQVNLVMWQTKYNSKTAPFNNMVLPLFWSELSVDKLPSFLHTLMMLMFKVGPVAQVILIFLLAIGGASLIATAGILAFVVVGATHPIVQRSPSLNIGYTAIRMIPIIRRESWIRDIKREEQLDNLLDDNVIDDN